MTDEPRSPDVLDPAPTVAGFDEARRAVKSARRVFLVTDAAALAPERLSTRDASRLFADIQSGVRPVVVTARVQSPDRVIRTVQWLGDQSRLGSPRDPADPSSRPSRSSSDGV